MKGEWRQRLDSGYYTLALPFVPRGTSTLIFQHKVFTAQSDALDMAQQLCTQRDVYFCVHSLKEPRVWNPRKLNRKTGELGAYETRTHKRVLDIVNPNDKTVDALMKLELAAGVDVQIKLADSGEIRLIHSPLTVENVTPCEGMIRAPLMTAEAIDAFAREIPARDRSMRLGLSRHPDQEGRFFDAWSVSFFTASRSIFN